MKWSKRMMISKNLEDKSRRLRWKVMHNVLCPGLYLITIASNKEDLLELIPQRELLQKGYPRSDLKIVGMASDYGDAIEMVKDICDLLLGETGSLLAEEYFFGEEDE